jgi:hypothetical protein
VQKSAFKACSCFVFQRKLDIANDAVNIVHHFIVPDADIAPRAIFTSGILAGGRDTDSAWEQYKLEARKMPENAQNPTCSVHVVLGIFSLVQTLIMGYCII